ncbi:hypothetical protein [Calothrix sp. NIES-2098]|uniref:hypothetical protein n=1 Tax=Calothrix sp. NIES-2098 TaxID=1954171 RepID=UPI000B61D8A1|nr:hypothetical protein NIES2098_34500 [Calothrix sp. NIES-2098]
MFGFDGNTKGFKTIIERIAKNDESTDFGKLTHKEVRAYARCMLPLVPHMNVKLNLEPELTILLTSLSASGLPHYDRSFIAARILKLLEESDRLRREEPGDESF